MVLICLSRCGSCVSWAWTHLWTLLADLWLSGTDIVAHGAFTWAFVVIYLCMHMYMYVCRLRMDHLKSPTPILVLLCTLSLEQRWVSLTFNRYCRSSTACIYLLSASYRCRSIYLEHLPWDHPATYLSVCACIIVYYRVVVRNTIGSSGTSRTGWPSLAATTATLGWQSTTQLTSLSNKSALIWYIIELMNCIIYSRKYLNLVVFQISYCQPI